MSEEWKKAKLHEAIQFSLQTIWVSGGDWEREEGCDSETAVAVRRRRWVTGIEISPSGIFPVEGYRRSSFVEKVRDGERIETNIPCEIGAK